MSMQGIATNLLLPPLLLLLVSVACGILLLLQRRLRRSLAAVVVAAGLAQLLLATPYVASALKLSLQRDIPRAADHAAPRAIIILGADAARSETGDGLGPLSLERVRAGAALARRTGLPLLVTAGRFGPDRPPLALLMAEALAEDFGTSARWIEPHAADTAGNARLSAALLRAEGIEAAYVVTHAWHLPRALEAFGRQGFVAVPAPVRRDSAPSGRLSDWIPRPDHLVSSWFALREWAGRLVYAVRDGRPAFAYGRQ